MNDPESAGLPPPAPPVLGVFAGLPPPNPLVLASALPPAPVGRTDPNHGKTQMIPSERTIRNEPKKTIKTFEQHNFLSYLQIYRLPIPLLCDIERKVDL